LDYFSDHYGFSFVSCICKFSVSRIVGYSWFWYWWTSRYLVWGGVRLVIAISSSKTNWVTLLNGLWFLWGYVRLILLFMLLLVVVLFLLTLNLLLLWDFLSCSIL
jgi:hypothetical protein